MKKLMSLSLFALLFLSSISTGSMSMDDDGALTTTSAQTSRAFYTVIKDTPSDIRRLNFNAELAKTKRALELLRKTPKGTTETGEADNCYTVQLLEVKKDAAGKVVTSKPRRSLGAAKALLEVATKAYQTKDRVTLGKLVQPGTILDTKQTNPKTGKTEWVFLNGHYVHVINDALLKLAGAAPLRPMGDVRPGTKAVDLKRKQTQPKKDANCPC